VGESPTRQPLQPEATYKDFPFFGSLGFIRSFIDSDVVADALADWRRGRLHAYKRPCWLGTVIAGARARIVTAQQDSIRSAAPRMRCVAWSFLEFACCRSDLSLSMPLASLCWE
jgi:hypothetical protein